MNDAVEAELIGPVSIMPAADTAIHAQDEIINLREETEANFLELGRRLDDFIDRSLHTELGYRTVNEWLDSRALGIGRTAGWNLIKTYRTFGALPEVRTPELASAGHEKLALVAPRVEAGEIEIDEAVELAREYSYRELVRRFKEPRAAVEKVECPTCGRKVKPEKASWLKGVRGPVGH